MDRRVFESMLTQLGFYNVGNLKQLFAAFDEDQDDIISYKEFEYCLKHKCAMPPSDEHLFAPDENKDEDKKEKEKVGFEEVMAVITEKLKGREQQLEVLI